MLGPFEGLGFRVAGDEEVAGDELLGLGKRPIGDDGPAVADAHRTGRRARLERARADELALGGQIEAQLIVRIDRPKHRLARQRFFLVGDEHDHEVVAPTDRPPPLRAGPGGADLDAAALAQRQLLRPCDRFVLGIGLDQVEPAEQFLGLDKRAIKDNMPAGLHADRGRAFAEAQSTRPHPLPGSLQRAAYVDVLRHDPVDLGC